MADGTNALVNLKPGWVVGGYEIVDEINRGAMAMSYKAKSGSGESVFLKSYKSPTVTVPWYAGYVAYQQELKRRIETSSLKHVCYRIVDFFEARKDGQKCDASEKLRKYFQVFEFVPKGSDLEVILDKLATDPNAYAWQQRLIWARVMLGAIANLHGQQIIHCDLKPPNLFLIEDKSIAAGYRLKLIDMDYSILADVPAPWHGSQGYAGTPGWFSPEHLRREVPLAASDVFTCALILGVLLGSQRLIPAEGYDEAALAGRRTRLTLKGPLLKSDGSATGLDQQFIAAIDAALDPDPARRPTAAELRDLLNGTHAAAGGVTASAAPPASAPAPVAPPPAPPAAVAPPPPPAAPPPPPAVVAPALRPVAPLPPAPVAVPPPAAVAPPAVHGGVVAVASGALLLSHATAAGQVVDQLRVSLNVNNVYASKFDPENARFLDHVRQYALECRAGVWWIVPNTAAVNETLLNGQTLLEQKRLKTGDQIAVGRAAKGIQKVVLVVTV